MSDILHNFILLGHKIFSQITSILLLLFKVLLSLRFNISNLRINILFKSRNNLLKSAELRIYSLIGCGNTLDNHCLNFLELGPLVIEFCFNCLLTAIYGTLDIVNHVLELLILLG